MRYANVNSWPDLVKAFNLPVYERRIIKEYVVTEVGGICELLLRVEQLEEECRAMDEMFMCEGNNYACLKMLYLDYCSQKKGSENKDTK